MTAAAATSLVIFAAGPVHADLGDTIGVVGTTTDQVVKPPVDAVVTPVKKVVKPVSTRVVAPVVKRTVTRTVTRVVAPVVTQTVAPVTTRTRSTDVSTSSGSPQTAAPRTSTRTGTSSTAPTAKAGGTAHHAARKPVTAARTAGTRARTSRPEGQALGPLVLRLNRAPVMEPAPLIPPVAHHTVGAVSDEDLRLPQSCLTPSLDLDELRRCAFAVRLGGTGGVFVGLLPTGATLVVTGALLVGLGRRRPRRMAVA